MKITVKYIHNKQAIDVKTTRAVSTWNNWRTYMQNTMRFNYENDRLNGLKMVEPSEEQIQASKGNY